MNNQEISIELLKLWQAYGNVEKIFFHNPLDNKTIIAAIVGENFSADFTFYAFNFFDFKSSDFEINKSGIKFKDFCIAKDGKIIAKQTSKDLKIEEINNIFHQYEMIRESFPIWEKQIQSLVQHISTGELEKVVISQKVELLSQNDFCPASILLNLLNMNEQSFVFAHHKNGRTFLGASPELLVGKSKNKVFSYALAGTMGKGGQNDAQLGQTLLKDEKNRLEHQIVINNIQDEMEKLAQEVIVGQTNLIELPNLFHLKTPITANSKVPLLDFVKTMHPSPALGGYPRDKALNLIKAYEKYDREQYGAPLGYVDKNGDGLFVVGIRSAYVEKNKISAFAGCGIVEQSKAYDEYLEVEKKLKTIINAV